MLRHMVVGCMVLCLLSVQARAFSREDAHVVMRGTPGVESWYSWVHVDCKEKPIGVWIESADVVVVRLITHKHCAIPVVIVPRETGKIHLDEVREMSEGEEE